MNRGAMLAARGMDRAARGEDPTADFDAAEAAYNEALRFDKLVRGAWERRGYLKLQKARWKLARGRDAAPDLQAAELDLTRCIEVSARFTMAWLARAMARRARGDLAAAEQDLNHLLEMNPVYPEAWIEIGHVRLDAKGKDSALLACRAYDRGFALDPTLEPIHRGARERARVLAGN